MCTESEQGENLSATTGPSLFFTALFATAGEVILPNSAWGTHITDAFGTKSVVFSKLQPSRVHGAEPSQAKTMTVSCDFDKLQLKTFIWGSFVDLADKLQASEITSASDLTRALKVFDDIQACEGGPVGDNYPNLRPECAYIDRWRVWRHILCSLYTAGTQCECCCCCC
ncbi:unnamed protein product, partial [Ixodes hexagonus]